MSITALLMLQCSMAYSQGCGLSDKALYGSSIQGVRQENCHVKFRYFIARAAFVIRWPRLAPAKSCAELRAQPAGDGRIGPIRTSSVKKSGAPCRCPGSRLGRGREHGRG